MPDNILLFYFIKMDIFLLSKVEENKRELFIKTIPGLSTS
jgi:hypothetical protein